MVLSLLMTFIFILLGMAFFTLCERKLLAGFQLRKGPNKVGFMGLLQPFADAGKLFTKEYIMLVLNNWFACFLAPFLMLFIALFMWTIYPILFNYYYVEFSILFFMCVSSLNVYGVMMAGWGSNSKYALLGGVRAMAQTISYEISFSFILLIPVFLSKSFSVLLICKAQHYSLYLMSFLAGFFMWFTIVLAETNRAPFDFVEGESELVSGFNVEYGGYMFALIFMAEYMNILFMSVITVSMFIGLPYIILPFLVLLVSYMFIWIRASFPRYRYDLLMKLTWTGFLPLCLSFMVFYIGWVFIVGL